VLDATLSSADLQQITDLCYSFLDKPGEYTVLNVCFRVQCMRKRLVQAASTKHCRHHRDTMQYNTNIHWQEPAASPSDAEPSSFTGSSYMYKRKKWWIRNQLFKSQSMSLASTHNMLSNTALQTFGGKNRERSKQELGKMTNRALTDLIVALLHEVAGPCHSRRGGQCHCCTVAAPASPPSPSPSAVPHRWVFEQPSSPFPDQPTNWPIVLSDPDAHPRGCQVGHVPSTVGIVPTGLH
jgi:hypothetical protein